MAELLRLTSTQALNHLARLLEEGGKKIVSTLLTSCGMESMVVAVGVTAVLDSCQGS